METDYLLGPLKASETAVLLQDQCPNSKTMWGFVLLDQHLTLRCFTMDVSSLKGHLLKCKLLHVSTACVLIRNVALRLQTMFSVNVFFPKMILCFHTDKLWSLEKLALKWCNVVACSTSTAGQVKAAVQLIISLPYGSTSGFGWVLGSQGCQSSACLLVNQTLYGHIASSSLIYTPVQAAIHWNILQLLIKQPLGVHLKFYALVPSISTSY